MGILINQNQNSQKPGDSVRTPRTTMYEWQKDCLDVWIRNGGRGIVNVVTGAGKTVFALEAIARLESLHAQKNNWNLKVKIVVPKVFLVNQWYKALREELGIANRDIGVYSGERKDPHQRKFMIYIINSARDTLALHMAEDHRKGNPILLIADECHRYGSEKNARIFEFILNLKNPAVPSSPGIYSLGLSATPETLNYQEKIIPALGPEIYRYSFGDALSAGVINHFAIFNIRLDFSQDEYRDYAELSDQITIVIARLRQSCAYLFQQKNSKKFFALLEQAASSPEEPDTANTARALLLLSIKRKELVYRARSRVSCVLSLLEKLTDRLKVIIFNERIDVTEELYEILRVRFPGQVGRYHSEMDEDYRRTVLKNYRNSIIRILVTCKALDEGLNVPETDVGIIVSSTNSSRQRIQRLGRILRRSKNMQVSQLFYLFVGSSNEDQELFAGVQEEMEGVVPMLDLRFDEKSNAFHCVEYEKLAYKVLEYARSKTWPRIVIDEISRNLELGKIGCDWWQSEDGCKQRIRCSPTVKERNYWHSMYLMVLARLKRLQ